VIKALGVSAVLAESFARIFYRNSINIGLAVIECPGVHQAFEEGDIAEIDLKGGVVRNTRTGVELRFKPWPPILREIYLAGGLVSYVKRRGSLG